MDVHTRNLTTQHHVQAYLQALHEQGPLLPTGNLQEAICAGKEAVEWMSSEAERIHRALLPGFRLPAHLEDRMESTSKGSTANDIKQANSIANAHFKAGRQSPNMPTSHDLEGAIAKLYKQFQVLQLVAQAKAETTKIVQRQVKEDNKRYTCIAFHACVIVCISCT